MSTQPVWHQRCFATRAARGWMRNAFFGIMRSAALTDDGRRIAYETLGDLLAWRPSIASSVFEREPPYEDLGCPSSDRAAKAVTAPVFITARFRSGSTLLWNLFRNVDGCTAYYEPFNERRWFDATNRGTRVDKTHRHVDEYAHEYDGLDELSRYFREDWIRRSLYMDGDSWDPAMAAYVRTILRRTPGRAVLQFNRIDFRLGWFRRTFPAATLIHLYRHPRDQWCSSLPDWAACPPSSSMEDFRSNDHYYLWMWAEDLKCRFPFLDPSMVAHPYQLFYFIWKLSFWFGVAYADYSLSFEELTSNPQVELPRLMAAAGIHDADYRKLCGLIELSPSRWPRYAGHEWFRTHEDTCENVLRDFFGSNAAVCAPTPAQRYNHSNLARFPRMTP